MRLSEAWDCRPGGRSPARSPGADVFRENNPNIPYTTEEIADSTIGAAQAGATVAHLHVREDDGTPSGRPELFVDAIDRIRAGCDVLTMVSTGGANDMTIEERTTRARGQARHLRGRVGLDELRRRDLHHAAAGRSRDRRARASRWGSRSRSSASTSATSSAPCAGSSRASSTAPLRINLVFGVPGRDRRLARGARRDAAAAAARGLLDRHLHRPPPPADARPGAAEGRARASAPGSRTSPTSPRASSRRRTPRWSRWRSGWRATSAARSPTRLRPGSCLAT